MQNSSRVECVIQKVWRVLSSTYFGKHRIEYLYRFVVCIATFLRDTSPLGLRKISRKRFVECCLGSNELLACCFIACTPFYIADTLWISCIECKRFGQAACPPTLNSDCGIHYLSHADERKTIANSRIAPFLQNEITPHCSCSQADQQLFGSLYTCIGV